jgi:hypothetical protein
VEWFLDGPLPKLFPVIPTSNQDGHQAFHQNLVLIEQMVSDEDFLWEFPIGSYVKLSSAVVAILVGGLKCQTHFGRGPPKDHFSKI